MSDQKNSTQTISKGETKTTRPRPIGGDFASSSLNEENESRITRVPDVYQKEFSDENLDPCLPAFGEIKFNLDFQLPIQVASTIFEAGKWTVLGAGEAVASLAKDIFVSEKPQNPEDQEKKMKESLIQRQSIETFKKEEERISQQEYVEMVKMALRMGVNVESLADKIQAPHLRKEELLRTYYIALGETIKNAEKKATEQALKNQKIAETNKKVSGNSMRLDAQEGNSMVANAIASAG